MKLEYHIVDVFTDTPLEGNALAVFPDAEGLDPQLMQAIAREMNLSETTFVSKSRDHSVTAKVKIFTPAFEMNFAGHPTIGTAYVLRMLGMVPNDQQLLVLEENVGPVQVRVDVGTNPLLWLTSPPITGEGALSTDLCAKTLGLNTADMLPGIPCELLTAGNPAVFVAVKDSETVDRASIDTLSMRKLFSSRRSPTCMFVFALTPQGVYSRMFAPELGVMEDPATGSVTGPLAAFMMKHRLIDNLDGTRFISEQGTKMGRRSILHVLVHGENGVKAIEVGGVAAHVACATMQLPAPALQHQRVSV